MTFHKRPNRKLKVVFKGWLQSPIPYVVRQPSGDFTYYFTYEPQRWGSFDTDDCWLLSSVNNAEANLNWLWANGSFSPTAKSFFISNGFCTPNGIFSLSEQFHEILCGNLDNGGTSPEAWQSFQARGFIPRSMLCYSQARAALCATQEAFVADYFNESQITPAMLALGQQSLQYINIAYQNIGTNIQLMLAAQLQAPLNLGIPIYDNGIDWNQVNVPADTDEEADHEVACRIINSNGSYGIYDQYQPSNKVLAAGYNIEVCTQGIITAVPDMTTSVVQQPTPYWRQFIMNCLAWFNGNPFPFPSVPIGAS